MVMHHHERQRLEALGFAIVTCSDSRTPDDDHGAALLKAAFEAAGHTQVFYRISPDDPEQIVAALGDATAAGADVILTHGGTGITARDWTYEAVEGLFTKALPGFGELFRMLSWEQVGAKAYLSRASAGLMGETALFVLPGSPKALSLAVERLILPEVTHLCWLARRDRGRSGGAYGG